MNGDQNYNFSIVFVCTGNICRSPLGEFLLRDKLKTLPNQFAISSAGTHALLGGQVPQEIVNYAQSQEVILQGHQPREMTAGIVGNADLILTAERAHRSEVVSLVPRASAKTFTLKQLARLAHEHELAIASGDIPVPTVASLTDLISELADFRSIAPPPESPQADDIEDPYRKSNTHYVQAGDSISQAVREIAHILTSYARP